MTEHRHDCALNPHRNPLSNVHHYSDYLLAIRWLTRAFFWAAAREHFAVIEVGARHIWLETSSLNVPGAAAYRGMGFELTGLDLTLYDATPAEGEVALFFFMPVIE